jgi:hypothetical protein
MRALLLCTLSLLSSCAASRTAHQVEVCLAGEADALEFQAFMRGVADRADLEFTDGASYHDRNSEVLGSPSGPVGEGRTIYFGARGRTGAGFSAANISLNPYQIALGMNATDDPRFDSQVVEATTAEILRRWPGRRVPSSEGFHPRPGCGEAATA